MDGRFFFTDDTAFSPIIDQPVNLLNDAYTNRGTNLFTVTSALTTDWTDNTSVNLFTNGTLTQLTTAGITIPTGVRFVMILTTGSIFCWNQVITRDPTSFKITNDPTTGFQVDDLCIVSGKSAQLNIVHMNANTNNAPISVQLIFVY